MRSNTDSKSKDDFRTCLEKSKVLKPEVFEKWLTENPDQTPKEDANQLIRKNLLTEWQAKYLLSGRYRLHLGNYQLLKRVRRDSFGDRFIALHPQLGRTVQVQVLPVELTDASTQRADFLKKAGLAGELDHPNLAHVFDIDKQQGRYYLVTEHSEGNSLAELRAKPLTASEIALVVRDSIAGLKYAHEQSVFHEHLSVDNVLINDDGVVKISQIALSPLATKSSSMAKENMTSEQGDLLAIVRIGRRLLNDAPVCRTTRELTDLFSNLNTKDESNFTSTLSQLESWIEQNPFDPTDKKTRKESKTDIAPMESVSAGEIERLTKNARRKPAAKNPESESQKSDRQKSDRKKNENWDKMDGSSNLVRNWGIAVTVIVLASLGHFGLQAIRQKAPSEQNQTAMRPTSASTRNQSLVSPKSAALLDSPQQNGSASDSELPTPVVDPNAFEPKPDDNPKPKANQKPRQRPETPIAQTDGMKPVKVEPATQPVSTQVNPEPDKPKPTKPVPEKTAAKPKPKKKAAPKKDDSKKKDSKPPEAFDGFPEVVDLPPVESVDEKVLAETKQSSLHLLSLEIKSPLGVGKGKNSFALERDETTKRKWTLLAQKTPKFKGDPVGEFEFDKESGQIKFHWLPEAAESKIAQYVRNCAIKVKQGGSSRTMALRSPVILSGLKLSEEEPVVKVEAAIDWLPASELLSVELLPHKRGSMPRLWFEPALTEPGESLVTHFHEAASNRFMWLQLDSDVRKKAKFELKLMLKHGDGTIQPITRSEDVTKLSVLLRQAAAEALREYNANKDIRVPKGKKTEFKEFLAKLKSNATKTQRQSEIAAENISIVEKFYGRVIPMRVTLRTDEYEVVLIESAR